MSDLGKLCYKANNGALAYKYGGSALIYKAQAQPDTYTVQIEMYPTQWSCYAHDNHERTVHTATLSCQFVLADGEATIVKTSETTDNASIIQYWSVTPVAGAEVRIQIGFSSTAEKTCYMTAEEDVMSGEIVYTERGPMPMQAHVIVFPTVASVRKQNTLGYPFSATLSFDSSGNLTSLN